MDARCRIALFGEVRLLREDRIVNHFRTRKAAHLLACLALPPGRSYTREILVDRFWPDVEPEAGRDSLITALSALRKVLEPDDVPPGTVLIADRQSVRLNAAAVSTDVMEFEELLREAARSSDPVRSCEQLGRAVGLYQGELVPDCYDDWIQPEQRRLAGRHLDALLRWAEALEEAGDLEEALDVAARAAALDPLREEACARRVSLYSALGRFSDARACYRDYERRLEDEAGASPPPSLRRLVDELGTSAAPVVRPGARTAVTLERPPIPAYTSPLDAVAIPRFPPLPLALNRFYGREAELARLLELLTPDDDETRGHGDTETKGFPCPGAAVRLVTITGPGGSGKTRLAVEVAHRIAGGYGDRAAFVALESLDDPGRMPGLLVRALGLSCSPEADPLESAASAIGTAPWLLILDNCEHLLAQPGPVDLRSVICRLLAQVPALRCLVTSRQALALEGECELRLAPLSTPSAAGMECESVALFLDRARGIDAMFGRAETDTGEIAALCERLEGLPLAIEMAAAWTRVLPPRLIRERLERDPSDLESRRQDAPLRHRSLRATLEWSFDLLEPLLRSAFAAFSVFRGGWTLAAAEAVCGCNALDALADLAERSLVAVEGGGARYRYLETVREYAQERLHELGASELRERHARYYIGLAEDTAAQAPGPGPSVWSAISQDYANLHQALEWLADTGHGMELARIVVTLKSFWVDGEHHLNDGVLWADRAVTLYSRRDATRAETLRTSGWLALSQARLDAARPLYDEALAIARELGDLRAIAAAGIDLARLSAEVAASAESRRLSSESLAILRDLGDRSELADGLFDVAGVMVRIGDWGTAETLLREGAEILRALGRRHELAQVLYGLATSARSRGELDTARALWEECVTIDEALGIRGGGALWGLGMVAAARGNAAEALRWYRRSLTENLESGNHRGVSEGLQTLAGEILMQGSRERSARLLGASLLQQSLTEQALRSVRRKQVDALAAELRKRLGSERCEALLQEGWNLDPEAAIESALADLAATTDSRVRPAD